MKPKRDKKPKKSKRAQTNASKNGRPTKRVDEVIDRVLEGLSMGTPLTLICAEEGMPSPRTIYDWMAEDEGLSAHIARAREAGFDRIAMDALEIADTPQEGVERIDTPDGPRIKRGDMLGHRRLQVETRLKLLAKWDPKRYGDKITQEISGPDGGPIQTVEEYRPTEADEAILLRIAAKRDEIRKSREAEEDAE